MLVVISDSGCGHVDVFLLLSVVSWESVALNSQAVWKGGGQAARHGEDRTCADSLCSGQLF